jgi:hypothetical protein
MKGRAGELATLARIVRTTAPGRVALVGAGGSGKSMLACALGHALARDFEGRLHWFRVGPWDFRTLAEMLALRFETSRERAHLVPGLRAFLAKGGARLVVLDNQEDDRVTARLLDLLAGTRATAIVTARRCLLGGVLVFPVTAPLVTRGAAAFPRVARLTRLLRWNPLALDVADALVASGAASARGLADYLMEKGITRVRVLEHEDDLPEVALLVAWAWRRLDAESKRAMAVLAHVEGDHVDVASLGRLGRLRDPARALLPLARWHLVQQPLAGRFTLHAVVRHAVAKRTSFAPARAFEHYVSMLEAHPERLVEEQTHLFAAMDHAHRASDLRAMLRVEELLARLSAGPLAG